ncbi:class C sortase [Tessaracoccus sp. HDW20]|nr:class C sortase [Tessaracoccus coleopterorum]
MILAGACIFLYPHVASWYSLQEQARATEAAQRAMQLPPNDKPSTRAEALDAARRYNEQLASGALFQANANVPTGDGVRSDDTLVYEQMLDLTGAGFMGRLRYAALDIDLPVYHGTSDETLGRGVGHLEGTSLPIGGVGTRSVLTAHRGLPTATLFDDLDKAVAGQTFTVSVLDHVVTYRVTEVQVIKPEDTQAILPDPGRDLLTLVTCTPLGVNSHRILVTGERITPTPPEELAASVAVPEGPGFPWWAVALGGTVVLLGAYIWRSGYPRAAAPRRA